MENNQNFPSREKAMLDALLKDILSMQAQISSMQSQLEKVYRLFDPTGKEQQIAELRERDAIMYAMGEQTKALKEVVVSLNREHIGQVEQNIAQERKRFYMKSNNKNLEYLKYINELPKTITRKKNTCTCGKHKGLNFKEKDGSIVLANVCPVSWWVSSSRLAYNRGEEEYSKFLRETPLEKFLEAFV